MDHISWQVVVFLIGVAFNLGITYTWVRQSRAEARALWTKFDAMRETHASDIEDLRRRQETHYRKILVGMTSLAAALPDNPGHRGELLEMLQRMAQNGAAERD